MPEPLSINLVHLKASETIAISAETKRRRAAGEEVYDLSLGEAKNSKAGQFSCALRQ